MTHRFQASIVALMVALCVASDGARAAQAPTRPVAVFVFGGGKAPDDPGILESVNDFRMQITGKFGSTMRLAESRAAADVGIEVIDRATNFAAKTLTVVIHARGGSTDTLSAIYASYAGAADHFLDRLERWITDTPDGARGLAAIDGTTAKPLPVYLHILDLKHRDAVVRANAATSLGRAKAHGALPALADLLDDSSVVKPILGKYRETTPLWQVATRSMLVIGGIEPLANVLKTSPDEKVRANAAYGLGEARGADAERVLSGALRQDQSARVRKAAAVSLAMLKASTAVDGLIAALGDPDKGVREEAGRALEAISGMRYGTDAAKWSAWAAGKK